MAQPLRAAGVSVISIILPDGETYKSSETLNLIYDALLQNRCERSTTLIALGGGVVGDITGYAAATYLRGVAFIQVPTTLLAQVDSSVGGKTGINHPLGKNMIGAFYQPQVVLADMTTLNTLPQRELSAGLAEVIKYGLIRDAEFFVMARTQYAALLARDSEALGYAIYRSCQKKLKSWLQMNTKVVSAPCLILVTLLAMPLKTPWVMVFGCMARLSPQALCWRPICRAAWDGWQ